MKCFAEVGNLCEHIHLPVQSGSDKILSRMNRKYTSAEYISKIERLREICPAISITTDIIVGFPGETEEDFESTLELMRRIRFDGAFSFKYSDRPGTEAEKLGGKLAEHVKGSRLKVMQKLQDEHTLERNRESENKIEEVLVEGTSRNSDLDLNGQDEDKQDSQFFRRAGFDRKDGFG